MLELFGPRYRDVGVSSPRSHRRLILALEGRLAESRFLVVLLVWGFSTLGICTFGLSSPLHGQPPVGYYDAAEGLSGAPLRNALHAIIDDHTVIPYSAAGFDVRDALDILDEDPSDPSRVILIYSGVSVAKSTWPNYNREHVWPVSLGSTEGTPAYSDVHHLFFCDAGVNSERNNRSFDWCSVDCVIPTEAPDVVYDFNSWEPPDENKGDVARATLYMDVRYIGDVAGELDLVIGNATTGTGCECMGRLDTLLAWHRLDPVDAREMERNDLIFDLIQGNRNPFVDHPEWVGEIWGTAQLDGVAWINEFHYDNSGADMDEGVEIAAEAGTNLMGWTLVAYNGNGFDAYDSLSLTGIVPDEGEGFGALWFPFDSLQNGAPDGIALVSGRGDAIEFLSYEGSIVAVDGPAIGQTSAPVGVAETTSTPVGLSLQRTGMGSTGPEFDWVGPLPHSRGQLNVDQILVGAGIPFVRGDCNADGAYNIADAISGLDQLFSGGLPTSCPESCDANSDAAFDVGDVIFVLGGLFTGAALPEAPHPDCAIATTIQLGCDSFAGCP